MQHHILYNPLAANGRGRKTAALVERKFPAGEQFSYVDLTAIWDLNAYLAEVPAEEPIIISGGDGTLHWLVNQLEEQPLRRDLYYHAAGSGNDFQKDVAPGKPRELIRLNEFLEALPRVEVHGQSRRFLNGVGFGLDGYCCAEGERLRRNGGRQRVHYTSIAALGLLYRYRPVNAEITVDGRRTAYQNVWLVPTMHGRYFGGGVKIAPDQDRRDPRRMLTAVVLHDAGRLRTLTAFPTALWGGHVRYKGIVEILTGWDIAVSFDRPAPMQIDGETIDGVTAYRACSALAGAAQNAAAV